MTHTEQEGAEPFKDDLSGEPLGTAANADRGLKSSIEERFFTRADLKAEIPTLSGEISREEALTSSNSYYVGRFVAGVMIEAEKILPGDQGAQFLLQYSYSGAKPSTCKRSTPETTE